MNTRLLTRCLVALFLLIIVVLYMPAFVKHRPAVVLFYIEDGRAVEAQLRVIARDLTARYKMRFHMEAENRNGEDVYTIFGATNNGWLYRFGLVRGSEPEFDVTFVRQRIDVTVDGPPDHPEVHKLVADWTSALDAAKIKYKAEIRTPLQPAVGP